MHRISLRTLLILSAVSMAAPGRAADPADPQAAVPPLHYPSSMKGLRPGTTTPVGDWRAANASVGRQGGHAHDSMRAGDSEPAADAGAVPETRTVGHGVHRHGAMPHAGHPHHPEGGGDAHRH